jgi:hypothetical protein
MKHCGEKGYSTVELMMVVGISSILAAAMYIALRAGNVHVENADLRMTLQDSAREGVYTMLQEIRESAPDRITIGNGCNSITFSIPDPSNPVDPTTYAVNWLGSQVTYSRNTAGQIQRALNGRNTILGNDVSSVMFTTDTAAPYICVTGGGADINNVSVIMNVQRNLKNGRAIPATPLQVAAQAKARNA